MSQNQTYANWTGMFLSLLISFSIFVGICITAFSAFAEATAQSWKWYASLIGGSLSGLMVVAAVFGMFLVWKRYLRRSELNA